MTPPTPKTLELPFPGGIASLAADGDPLPQLPEGTPVPKVSIELSGEIRTVVTLNGFPVRFWGTGGINFNEVWDTRKRTGSWVKFLTAKQLEAMEEWGTAVHNHLDAFAYQLLVAALTTDVEERMVEFAVAD